MADPVLKFPPEQRNNPALPTSRPKLAAEPRRRLRLPASLPLWSVVAPVAKAS